MAGGVRQDVDEMSRAITISDYSSENIASRALTPSSNARSNEMGLATQVERINRIIEKVFLRSFTIARGLAAVSKTSTATDDQEAVNFSTMEEYLRARGLR